MGSGAGGGGGNVPKFLIKLWSMVDDKTTDPIVSWSNDGTFFVIKDQIRILEILPYYFKHNNLASFVRQLNLYGFNKISDDQSAHAQINPVKSLAFAHKFFIRDHIDDLVHIRRKGSNNVPSVVTVDSYGSDQKIYQSVAPPVTRPILPQPTIDAAHLSRELQRLAKQLNDQQIQINQLKPDRARMDQLTADFKALKEQHEKQAEILSHIFNFARDQSSKKRKFEQTSSDSSALSRSGASPGCSGMTIQEIENSPSPPQGYFAASTGATQSGKEASSALVPFVPDRRQSKMGGPQDLRDFLGNNAARYNSIRTANYSNQLVPYDASAANMRLHNAHAEVPILEGQVANSEQGQSVLAIELPPAALAPQPTVIPAKKVRYVGSISGPSSEGSHHVFTAPPSQYTQSASSFSNGGEFSVSGGGLIFEPSQTTDSNNFNSQVVDLENALLQTQSSMDELRGLLSPLDPSQMYPQEPTLLRNPVTPSSESGDLFNIPSIEVPSLGGSPSGTSFPDLFEELGEEAVEEVPSAGRINVYHIPPKKL